MQLMKISLVPYKKNNYVKNKVHKERDYSRSVRVVCSMWRAPEYSAEMFRVIKDGSYYFYSLLEEYFVMICFVNFLCQICNEQREFVSCSSLSNSQGNLMRCNKKGSSEIAIAEAWSREGISLDRHSNCCNRS